MEPTNNTLPTSGPVSCPACKTVLENSAKFCPNCGSPAKKEEPPKPAVQPMIVLESPAPAQETPQKTTALSEPRKPLQCPCGQILPDKARFCHQCGKPLKSALYRLVCSGKPVRTFDISDSEILIGKAAECQIALAEDEFVSRQHARLVIQDGKPVLEDLNSSNGTYVKIQTPIQLQPGHEFLIGTHLFRLEKNTSQP